MKSEKALLRKYEDDLHVGGIGVIIMGVWSIVKVLIEIFTNTKEFFDVESDDPVEKALTIIVILVFIGAVSVIVMYIHLYIGLNAMKAARGLKYKKRFHIVTIIYTVISIAALITYKEDLKDIQNIDTTIASILVDLTTIYILIVVFISAINIKKLKEKLFGEPGQDGSGNELLVKG